MNALHRFSRVAARRLPAHLRRCGWLLSWLLLLSLHLSGQATVRGRVLSADEGAPLPGVAVTAKSTGAGTVTNASGDYEIPVRQDLFSGYKGDTLIFSYIGYRTLVRSVIGEAKVNIYLEPAAAELDEVIVTGSAVGRSKKLLSYSVGNASAEQLSAVPAAMLGVNMQGRIPGLRVNQVGGQPGQGAFFQVRSANSIANGQQPLLIVDGTFINGATLADFNAEDVARIEILKGSAGTSLYGSQAANGVVQVFTKRGQDLGVGQTRITYRHESGFSEALNDYDLNTATNREVLSPGGPQPVLGALRPDQRFGIPLPNLQDYQASDLFQRGRMQTNYLAIEGKSNQTNYLVSAQHLRDEGILQRFDGYTRYNARFNADHRINNRLSINSSAMYTHSTQDWMPPAGTGQGSYLANVLLLAPMFGLDATNDEDGSPYDWDIDNTGANVTNPRYLRANSEQTVQRSRLLGSLGAVYAARDWLVFSYAAGLDRTTNDFEHFLSKGHLPTNPPALFGPLATSGVQGSAGGGIHRSHRSGQYFSSRANVTAQRAFMGFNTAVRGSFLYEDLRYRYDEAIGENLAVAHLRSLDNARSNISIASEQQDIVAYSGFLVADADYKEKYIFSGLLRREGSSLFGPEARWANYYRASAAWRVTQDRSIKGIQELKLRAAVGTAGIRPAFEQRFETFELVNGALAKNTLGNTALKPAYSTETEVGINMTFLKAFELEFNYARISTRDQVLLVPLSGATGFRGQWRNAGTVEGTVYEAFLHTDFKKLFKIPAPRFHWHLSTTFDRVQQRVSQLDAASYNTGPGIGQSALFLVAEGQSLGTMVGEVFATDVAQLQGQEGINPAEYSANAAGYLVRSSTLGTPEERPLKLRDASGNPLVQVIGDINPRFRMGFAHHIGYGGLELYALLDWKKGGDVYNLTKQVLYGAQRHADLAQLGDIAAGFFGPDGLYNGQVANNHFVEDGSFLMLREAALSYTVRQGLLRGALKELRLSLIARNLLTITGYSGYHPDVSAVPRDENTLTQRFAGARGSDPRTPGGDPALFLVDAFNYPLARSFAFSIQVRF